MRLIKKHFLHYILGHCFASWDVYIDTCGRLIDCWTRGGRSTINQLFYLDFCKRAPSFFRSKLRHSKVTDHLTHIRHSPILSLRRRGQKWAYLSGRNGNLKVKSFPPDSLLPRISCTFKQYDE